MEKVSALIGWLQLDLREDFADVRWIVTLALSWGQFSSAHHLFPAFSSSLPLSPILSMPEVTSEVSGMISCVYFYLLSPIYLLKAIFFLHSVPVMGNSLTAHHSLTSLVTVLNYITVQSPSLKHWHLETTHCFSITRVPDGSSKDWPWIYDLQKQSGWGKLAVVILLKHTQTFCSLSLIDPPCVSQCELFT